MERQQTRGVGDERFRRQRELMVHIFYPRNASVSGERAVYLPDADALRGEWSDATITRIRAMRSFSHENAPVASATARYPVAIFSPGVGMKTLMYGALIEDLASHGWVVAAIDPPYNAQAVRFPDGRVLGDVSPAEKRWPPGFLGDDEYAERVMHWSRDVSFVIDQLTALDSGSGAFAHRLDLQHGVAVFGHSFGGTMAGKVRLVETRVRAVINLDGMMIEDLNVGGPQPLLWLARRQEGRGRGWYLDTASREVVGPGLRVLLNRPRFTHGDFADEPFWDGPITPASRTAKLKAIADIRKWVRTFFAATVRGDWVGLKRLAGHQSTVTPNRVKAFGAFWRSKD